MCVAFYRCSHQYEFDFISLLTSFTGTHTAFSIVRCRAPVPELVDGLSVVSVDAPSIRSTHSHVNPSELYVSCSIARPDS
jgi:hypothetical protein